MAEVLAILGALLVLAVIFPGILIAWRLLFPATVERARLRLDRTPCQCFWLGLVATVILLPIIVVMLVLPLELARVAGYSLFFIVLAFAGLGAAGLAAKTGRWLVPHADSSMATTAASVRGTLVLELATGFWLGGVTTVILLPAIVILLDLPLYLTWLVGWSLFFVVLALAGLGAAALAARRGGRLAPHANNGISPAAAFMRGAVALELATGFPIIGWFIVMPLTFITALGATVFALLRWAPSVAAPAAGKEPRMKRIVVSSIVVLWVLPFVAISLSVVAFLVRGAVAIELAVSFPIIVWLVVIPLYIITVLGATAFALLRWGRWWRRTLPAGS